MAVNLQTIIDYYTNLLIVQYHDKPNAQATIQAIISNALTNGIIFQIADSFDIDTAVGKQLDILGKWVGIDRLFTSSGLLNLPAPLFSFTDTAGMISLLANLVNYPPNIVGFGNTASWPSQVGKMLENKDLLSFTQMLNDNDFRIVIKFKILYNTINSSYESIYEGIYKYFQNDVVITSSSNMSMDVWIDSASAPVANITFQKGVFPKPMGVQLRFIISTLAPFFSYTDTSSFLSLLSTPQNYPPNIVGFGNTANFNIQIGKMMQNNDILNIA